MDQDISASGTPASVGSGQPAVASAAAGPASQPLQAATAPSAVSLSAAGASVAIVAPAIAPAVAAVIAASSASGMTPTTPAGTPTTDSEIKGRFKVKHITTDTVLAGTAIKAQVVVVGTPAAHVPSTNTSPQNPSTSSQPSAQAASTTTATHMTTAPSGLIRIPSMEIPEVSSGPGSDSSEHADTASKAPKKSRFTVKTISKEDDRSEGTHAAQDRTTPTLPSSGGITPATSASNTPMAVSAARGPVVMTSTPVSSASQSLGHHHHHHSQGQQQHALAHHGASHVAAPSPLLVTGAVAHASMLLTPARPTQPSPSAHSHAHANPHGQHKTQTGRDDQIERMMQILEVNNKILLSLSGQLNAFDDHAKDASHATASQHTTAGSHAQGQQQQQQSHAATSSHPAQPSASNAAATSGHAEKDSSMEPPVLARSLSMNTGLTAPAASNALHTQSTTSLQVPSSHSNASVTATSAHSGPSSLVPFASHGSSSLSSSSSSTSSSALMGTAAADQSFARFSHHLTEMKREFEVFGKTRRENATEIQRLREKCQQLEDRATSEHSRCVTLEDRLEKSAQKNRYLLNQIEALTAILAAHNINTDGSIIPTSQTTASSSLSSSVAGAGVAPAVSANAPSHAPMSADVPASSSHTILTSSTSASAQPMTPAVMPHQATSTSSANTSITSNTSTQSSASSSSLSLPAIAPIAIAAPAAPRLQQQHQQQQQAPPMVMGKVIMDTGLASMNSPIGGGGGYGVMQKPIGLQLPSAGSGFISSSSSSSSSASSSNSSMQAPPLPPSASPLVGGHHSIFHAPHPGGNAATGAHLSAPVANPMLSAGSSGSINTSAGSSSSSSSSGSNTGLHKQASIGAMNFPMLSQSGGGPISSPLAGPASVNINSSGGSSGISSSGSSGGNVSTTNRLSIGSTAPLLRPMQG